MVLRMSPGPGPSSAGPLEGLVHLHQQVPLWPVYSGPSGWTDVGHGGSDLLLIAAFKDLVQNLSTM